MVFETSLPLCVFDNCLNRYHGGGNIVVFPISYFEKGKTGILKGRISRVLRWRLIKCKNYPTYHRYFIKFMKLFMPIDRWREAIMVMLMENEKSKKFGG